MDFKLKLKELRRLAGFRSMRSVAEALGVPTSTYASWECGTRALPLDRAVEIAELFGCTLDELAGRKPVDKATYYLIDLTDEQVEQVGEYADFLRQRGVGDGKKD